MEERIRRLLINREDVVFEANPFTLNLAEAMYKAGKIKENSLAGLNSKEADLDRENNFEPEELLNFDAGLYPEHFYFSICFIKKRMDKFEVMCDINKVGNEMMFGMCLCMNDADYHSYPFNLGRIQFETNNQYDGINMLGDDYTGEGDTYFAKVYCICPATGNMLQNFNHIWAQVETIYTDVINRLIKEIKDNY